MKRSAERCEGCTIAVLLGAQLRLRMQPAAACVRAAAAGASGA